MSPEEKIKGALLFKLTGIVPILERYADEDVRLGEDFAGRVHIQTRTLTDGKRPGARRARAAFN